MAGMVVGVIGVDALRHVHRPAEKLLAAIPVVLAGHSLIEAFVWWGLQDRVPAAVWRPAVWLYLAIAFGVLPMLVPLAVGALEPLANRRRIGVFTATGVVVAAVLMVRRRPGTGRGDHRRPSHRLPRRSLARRHHRYALPRGHLRVDAGVEAQPCQVVRRHEPRRCLHPRVAEQERPHLTVVRLGGDHEHRHRRPPPVRGTAASTQGRLAKPMMPGRHP
jgi:hypothetical protein